MRFLKRFSCKPIVGLLGLCTWFCTIFVLLDLYIYLSVFAFVEWQTFIGDAVAPA